MEHRQFTVKLKAALRGDLPGTDVQWELASSDRKIKNFPRSKRKDSQLAAVLILIYPLSGSLHTLFIQRPVYQGVHSGQISFPGGKMEKGDKDLRATAIRETWEETGLCAGESDILGPLTPLYIPVSNIEVSPFVAYLPQRPELRPCKDEVVSVIEAPLSIFFDESTIKEKEMLIRDELLRVKFYDYKDLVIWGATAMMLHELTAVIKSMNK